MKPLTLLLCLLLALPIAARETLPEPDLPAGIRGHWIARYMELNDLPMNIRGFETFMDTEQFDNEAQAFLKSIGQKVLKEQDKEGWTTYATADNNAFYSLRVTASGSGTQGVFTVSALEPKALYRETLPNGVLRIQKQTFFDGPHIQEFEVFSTLSGTAESRVLIEQILKRRGWAGTREYVGKRIEYARGKDHASVTIQPNQTGLGTLVLVSKELAK